MGGKGFLQSLDCYLKDLAQWSVVSGQWLVVSGQWSVVNSQVYSSEANLHLTKLTPDD
jgi:hypothetical protein